MTVFIIGIWIRIFSIFVYRFCLRLNVFFIVRLIGIIFIGGLINGICCIMRGDCCIFITSFTFVYTALFNVWIYELYYYFWKYYKETKIGIIEYIHIFRFHIYLYQTQGWQISGLYRIWKFNNLSIFVLLFLENYQIVKKNNCTNTLMRSNNWLPK